jgi:hypothetical protein
MTISDWFKKLFSSRSSIDEARIDAGGGGTVPTTEDAGIEAEQLSEDELSDYDAPSE